MVYKLDLHTHSILSYDGGISEAEYISALNSGKLDQIAITDHNEIKFALALQQKLGDKIIIGEEIMAAGSKEIVGLFLKTKIEPGQSIRDTIAAVKAQGGIVYIPHLFDTYRHGIGMRILEENVSEIDIVEVYNSRSFLNWRFRGPAKQKLNKMNLVLASGSDSHSPAGLGRSYNEISAPATAANICQLIKSGNKINRWAPVREFFAPSINKSRKKVK